MSKLISDNTTALMIARLLKLKPLKANCPCGVVIPTATMRWPRALTASSFLTKVITRVSREVTKPSLASTIRSKMARLNILPLVAAIPNSEPFSRVLANAGSLAIRDLLIPPLVLTKYPSLPL